jgi:predicted transport protein
MSLKSFLKKLVGKKEEVVEQAKEIVSDVKEAVEEKDISKVQHIIEEVKEEIAEIKEVVEEDVREKYTTFVPLLKDINHQTHTLCMALFLKQLITRTKNSARNKCDLDLEHANLHFRIISSFKYVIKELITNYKANIHIVRVDETAIVLSAIAYLTKLGLNKKAASAFRKDLLVLAKELKTEEDLNKYIASHKLTTKI